MRRSAFVALALSASLILSACSYTLTIPLPPQTLALPPFGGTGGQVFYPKEGMRFPGVGVKAVSVEGRAVSNRPLSLAVDFYARLSDPASDPNCTDLQPLVGVEAYACSVGEADSLVGVLAFDGGSEAPLSLQGGILAQGVSQGKLWLGAAPKGEPPADTQITIQDLKAKATVGL